MSLLGVFREDLDNPVSVICVFLLEAALSSAFRSKTEHFWPVGAPRIPRCQFDSRRREMLLGESSSFFLVVDVLGDVFHRHASRCTHDIRLSLQPNRVPEFC